ncbi:MAG TPA: hypothetical protein VG389_04735, partial [Myxococcota bacterium]|nr:hypothetical protein [Myxococcota bacterium]
MRPPAARRAAVAAASAALVALAGAAALLAVPEARAVARRDTGGEIVVSVPPGPAAADPAHVTTLASAIYAAAVYDTLYVVRRGADSKTPPEPLLAAGPPEP